VYLIIISKDEKNILTQIKFKKLQQNAIVMQYKLDASLIKKNLPMRRYTPIQNKFIALSRALFLRKTEKIHMS